MRFDLPAGEELDVPSVEDVHWIHDNAALLEGGRPGILSQGALESALSRPVNVLLYSEEDPDLLRLAAYLWHGVSEAHAYVDGNKRTAVLTMIAFLEANGITYLAPEREVGGLVDSWYRQGLFYVDLLDAYLRTRCHWTV